MNGRCLLLALWTIAGAAANLPAQVMTSQEVVLDFTQQDAIATLAKWSDPQFLNVTPEGLGWDGGAKSSRDVTIETLQPIPVGWSWHPVTALHIEAESIPAGEFRFGENAITWPSTAGTLFARYSPDGEHWSTWQALSLREPRDKDQPRLWFQGTLRVPEQARLRYTEQLKQFAKTDRLLLGTIDQEAAVRWIVDQEPKFFEEHLPFIGYVEFLWEKQIRGNQRLRQLKITLQSGRGGFGETPAGHQQNDRWRFRAPAKQSPPAR
jgi:hypothetical protein